MIRYNVVVTCSFEATEYTNEYEPSNQTWEEIMACYNEQVIQVLKEVDEEDVHISNRKLNDNQPLIEITAIGEQEWNYEIYVCKYEI